MNAVHKKIKPYSECHTARILQTYIPIREFINNNQIEIIRAINQS